MLTPALQSKVRHQGRNDGMYSTPLGDQQFFPLEFRRHLEVCLCYRAVQQQVRLSVYQPRTHRLSFPRSGTRIFEMGGSSREGQWLSCRIDVICAPLTIHMQAARLSPSRRPRRTRRSWMRMILHSRRSSALVRFSLFSSEVAFLLSFWCNPANTYLDRRCCGQEGSPRIHQGQEGSPEHRPAGYQEVGQEISSQLGHHTCSGICPPNLRLRDPNPNDSNVPCSRRYTETAGLYPH